jgi:hypothetical protein
MAVAAEYVASPRAVAVVFVSQSRATLADDQLVVARSSPVTHYFSPPGAVRRLNHCEGHKSDPLWSFASVSYAELPFCGIVQPIQRRTSSG